jgi:hypothetical protein
MAESVVEQIVDNIKTELEAVSGDNGTTYWYTPEKVVRVDYYLDQYFKSATGYGPVVYFLRDTGDDRRTRQPEAFGDTARELDVFIMATYQDNEERDPFKTSTNRGTVRNRMLQDVEKVLEANYHRSGLAFNTELIDVRRDFREPQGWILGELYFVVTYTHDIGAP